LDIELKDFQRHYIEQLVGEVRLGRNEVGMGKPQVIVLSAPTGSGKTLMATRLMETIVEGDDSGEGDPQATFLWITDQPELNEQTLSKILEVSSVFGPDRIVTIDASFDQEELAPQTIHFLNTQKLMSGSHLVTPGDERTNTIWETISRTVDAHPQSFFVILDEAHKGMGQDASDRARAATIVQKFIKGLAGEIPPIPFLVGISATPERFSGLLAGTTPARTVRSVDVPADEVMASGLLKETILLFHPDEDEPADITLLKGAASSLQEYETEWLAYQDKAKSGEVVRPILVVQVEDGTGKQLTNTNLDEAIRTIEEVLGPLEDTEIAHSFQEHQAATIHDRELRYCAPSKIQEDPELRVVFFKRSLNTGWDCPRAEVMMSFRKAVDHTLIAQLVGRMVRTPLARRIETDDFLNTVSLYLPHYDREGLAAVIERLRARDPDAMPPVKVERGEAMVRLKRNAALVDCFEAIKDIPSYYLRPVRKLTNVRRLLKLARLLAKDGLDPAALASARTLLLQTLEERRGALKDTEEFRKRVKESGTILVRSVEYAYGDEIISERIIELEVTPENVNDLFVSAGKKLGEGLHKLYWKSRIEGDRTLDQMLVKLELCALVADNEAIKTLEATAKARIDELLIANRAAINGLSPDSLDRYQQVRRTAKDPEPIELVLPDFVQGKKAETRWERHLFIDDDGLYPCDFSKSSWELRVLEKELAPTSDVVGWLRNEPRKEWSLCVPYRGPDGENHPVFPDFLFFRRDGDDIIVDILDPHSPSLADAHSKAVGLAQYAAKHAHHFGRIQIIHVEDESIRRLDITREDIRDRVQASASVGELVRLFEDLGETDVGD
jgi:type III restriction enzyme